MLSFPSLMGAFAAKMAIIWGGLKAVIEIGSKAIDWLTKAFENLLFFDFGRLFTGNDNTTNIINYDDNIK